jgi:hypothetical protein
MGAPNRFDRWVWTWGWKIILVLLVISALVRVWQMWEQRSL